jgi:hypothetical protein
MPGKKLKIAPAESKSVDEVVAQFMTGVGAKKGFKENIEYIKQREQQFVKFTAAGKSKIKDPQNQLVVLRRWNSFTPILPSKKGDRGKGGGYFLRFRNVGIVIDPGFNFIDSFLQAGFKLDDIDYVFISHAHNDHTVELEGLFSLLYKRNERSRRKPKKIKLYMNLGSFKKFSSYFDLSNPAREFYVQDIVLLNRHQLVKVTDSLEVFTTQAQHHEMVTKAYALGFTFILRLKNGRKRVIKFTCDTGWNKAVEEENTYQGEAFGVSDIDILVAHLGTIKERELKYDAAKSLKENERFLYKNHLGLIGTLAAIHTWRPGVVLLSEFGEELDAIRHKIAKELQKFLNIKVFATDINFRMDIDTLNVMCFKTKKFWEHARIQTVYNGGGQLYFLNKDKLSAREMKELKTGSGAGIHVFSQLTG